MAAMLAVALVGSLSVGAVDVRVDPAQARHPISPLIYGINGGSDAQLKRMGVTARRWGGGNPSTRFNWKTLMANRASDYFFENISGSQGNPDDFIRISGDAGVPVIMPITTLGWVASNTDRACGFGFDKYPNQAAGAGCADPYHPNCGKGLNPGANCYAPVASDFLDAGSHATDTSFDAGADWAHEWVGHLASEGVHFYQLDNEPGLWSSTHRDVHPQRTTYAEMRSALFSYAPAIKSADPSARVMGPISWGWTEYLFLTWEQNNNPDHDAYGDFVPWYLQQAKNLELDAGVRMLDYLDLHYYPQENGVYSADTSEPTNVIRLQSTRSLWDSTWTDPTWIGTPVMLIPRMRDWVNTYYPGTKTAISEYSWGAIDDPVGAIAQTDLLGIFGREQLDLATLFWPPSDGSIGEDAFKVFRNYDGAGARFGDTSVLTRSSAIDVVTAYAAEVRPGVLTLLVINKDPAEQLITVTIADAGVRQNYRRFPFGRKEDGGVLHLGQGIAGFFPNGVSQLLVPARQAWLFELTEVTPADGGLPGLDAGGGPSDAGPGTAGSSGTPSCSCDEVSALDAFVLLLSAFAAGVLRARRAG